MADPIETFLNRLQHPVMAGIDYKLERMQRLMSLLKNPERRLPPVVHVAGTNGKGSVIAYLKAIFEAAGLTCHVYTSPHLVEFRERIIVAGKMAENRDIQSALTHISRVLPQQPATFFEAATAAAFLLFAQKKADVLLMEVGMGGRLDATNIIDNPAVTVITPVAMDHTEYLGDTLEKIAAEKAGIIKSGVPCVVGEQLPQAMQVIEAKAKEKAASLHQPDARGLPIQPSLVGAHQLDNAATAIACIDQLPQFNIGDEHILKGIASAVWPGRIQKLKAGPLVSMLPDGIECYLDGGHNEQGGAVLAAWLKDQKEKIQSEQGEARSGGDGGVPPAHEVQIFIICGMLQGKSSKPYLQHLAPHVKKCFTIAIPEDPKTQHPDSLAAVAKEAGMEAEAASSPEAAMQAILAEKPQSGLVVIAGSLYLAGHILRNHN